MAISSLFLILAVLLVLLALGVPIAYSIGIAALTAILPTMSLDVSNTRIWSRQPSAPSWA